ncbi:ketopantoate reductase family protein [Consotaella aegiceratis]|uniref:ketopantoate reductase family protein n=1 Tax=Consotaella aegiceratis TaxID=3097961 RepID=UPI002F418E68
MPQQNICIFGAGAIGGALAVRLMHLDDSQRPNVSVVARGAHLAAIRERGLRIEVGDPPDAMMARPHAVEHASELGPQDLVFVTLKGHQLSAACDDIVSLLGPKTRLVLIQNGIPWWYFHGDRDSGFEDRPIEMLDPDGRLWETIGPERVIAGVAYQGAQMIAPGTVQLAGIGRFIFGEPSGAMTGDLAAIVDLVGSAGWTVTASPRIRDTIWTKLQGNASFNPLSALTRSTMDELLRPTMVDVAREIMHEVRAVAEALGAHVDGSAEERIVSNGGVGRVKTSMLQDLELGRRLEFVPITAAVCALAKMVSVKTPINDTVLALISQLDKTLAEASEPGA